MTYLRGAVFAATPLLLALASCSAATDAAEEASEVEIAKGPQADMASAFKPKFSKFIASKDGKPGKMVFEVTRNLDPSVKVTRFAISYVAYVGQNPVPTPNPGLLPGFQGDLLVCNEQSPDRCPTGTFDAMTTVRLLCAGDYPRNPAQPLVCGETISPGDMIEVVINWKEANGTPHAQVHRVYAPAP
ncbi:MAG: hypothetical protein WAT93_12150 [Pontixanthobacter sp.]